MQLYISHYIQEGEIVLYEIQDLILILGKLSIYLFALLGGKYYCGNTVVTEKRGITTFFSR